MFVAYGFSGHGFLFDGLCLVISEKTFLTPSPAARATPPPAYIALRLRHASP